jgi:hypothetical protein
VEHHEVLWRCRVRSCSSPLNSYSRHCTHTHTHTRARARALPSALDSRHCTRWGGTGHGYWGGLMQATMPHGPQAVPSAFRHVCLRGPLPNPHTSRPSRGCLQGTASMWHVQHAHHSPSHTLVARPQGPKAPRPQGTANLKSSDGHAAQPTLYRPQGTANLKNLSLPVWSGQSQYGLGNLGQPYIGPKARRTSSTSSRPVF